MYNTSVLEHVYKSIAPWMQMCRCIDIQIIGLNRAPHILTRLDTRRTVRKIDTLPLQPTRSAHQTQIMTAEVLRGFPEGGVMNTRTERWIEPVVAMHHLAETGTERGTEWVETLYLYIVRVGSIPATFLSQVACMHAIALAHMLLHMHACVQEC